MSEDFFRVLPSRDIDKNTDVVHHLPVFLGHRAGAILHPDDGAVMPAILGFEIDEHALPLDQGLPSPPVLRVHV